MHKYLNYPFDSKLIMRKKKQIRRELFSDNTFLEKKIAILGGSTTNDIKEVLELFLLNYGIKPEFYESEYAQYWQDAMFGNDILDSFDPDFVYIHTSNRNIMSYPEISDTAEMIEDKLAEQYERFCSMWEKIHERWNCPIIQNNFEYPFYRLMGNQDCSDIHGRCNFISRLNLRFFEYASDHEYFFINDINYQSSYYGLEKWSDPYYWHMYKYAMCLEAVPTVAFNVANIIKAILGKNKKALALDLDNTLWGGVVGDDGVENLELGQEVSMGQVYTEFQIYLKELQKRGVLLNIISKNDPENAMAGLNHPQMVLRPDDFISIKANWEPKSQNLLQMAHDLELLPESFVFVDDNPAEREIIRQQVKGTAVPEIGKVENYIMRIDHAGYFESTGVSKDDLNRNAMYRDNIKRKKMIDSFSDYSDYLRSLKMTAQIKTFEKIYMSRIAQLTNKSNQFNLTTRRYTQDEIEKIADDNNYITLYGKLEDKFGDNGVVSLVIGNKKNKNLDIILWLMSCRVLKRDMEYAMMDTLVDKCRQEGIEKLFGYYYKTEKNNMVKDFYDKMNFTLLSEDEEGNSKWELDITNGYEKKNHVIKTEV